tara:strand:+ start:107 stop:304 length:198 start_codon:yes stop_codon:yes gene_type:complete
MNTIKDDPVEDARIKYEKACRESTIEPKEMDDNLNLLYEDYMNKVLEQLDHELNIQTKDSCQFQN